MSAATEYAPGGGGRGGRTVARAAFGAVPPPALVIAGTVSVQLGAGLAKHLFAELSPGSVVAIRFATSALALLAIARPRIAGRGRRDLLLVIGFGLVLAAMNFAFYQAIARIPLGVTVTVEFLGPLTVALLGSRRRVDLLWVLLAGGGVVLLAGSGGPVSLVGLGCALLAAVCWGTYIFVSGAVGRAYSGASGLALAMCLAAVLTAPIGVAHGAATFAADPALLAVGAAVGVLSSVIPYGLEMEALRRLPARTFGILMSLEPAVAALIGLALLGELLGIREWLAIAMVVAASVGATRATRPNRDV